VAKVLKILYLYNIEYFIRKRMKKLLSVLSIVSILSVSAVAQNLKAQLEQACNQQSQPLLVKFFENWNKEIPSISNSELLSKDITTTDAYYIFNQLYDPLHLSKITGYTAYDSTYAKNKYAIVQNSLKISFLHIDTLRQQSFEMIDSVEKTFEIADFKPQLLLENLKVVYYSSAYQKAINEFLGLNGVTKEKEFKFFNQLVNINNEAPGSLLKVVTHPYVECINFNRKQTMARVDFYLVNQKGTTYFIKENKKWKMIWSGLSKE
jgi:hypothetical protein